MVEHLKAKLNSTQKESYKILCEIFHSYDRKKILPLYVNAKHCQKILSTPNPKKKLLIVISNLVN